MMEQKLSSDYVFNRTFKFNKSRRIQIIKNFMYLLGLLDFLLHYAILVEMYLFKQIYLSFTQISDSYSTAIPVCELPIKQYLPFSLSQMSLYIFCLVILSLLLLTESIRKSSSELYCFYTIIKCILSITSFILCIIYSIAHQNKSFILSSLILPHSQNETNSISITIDACLIYTREKIAINILAISNLFICFMSMECSKVFSLLIK
ncbi:unnamed protein product [Rotaria magnacalcarata]|uniref:Transmembrane protein n=1 Tax=Rotaria magnacalcarata TaxID=392030 RepID=A0A819NS46_9BILA|nr:unnamed protein product [Rotaria magnacalcarata]CAF4001011.1 unnamed protein product [Rotaria magnacalcarata]